MESPTLANVEDVYPLTAMQQGMLYHTIAAPSSGVYVNQIATPVAGDLDAAALASAYEAAVSRHETLRTAFLWEGLDEPLQVVRTDADVMWTEHDLSSLDERVQKERMGHILEQDRWLGFDLSRAPLSRMALVRMGQGQWVWVWTFHHLIADGWSVQLILDEVIATYRSIRMGTPLALTDPPRYRDFIAHYLGRDKTAEEAFWSSVLKGFSEPHQLEAPGLPPRQGSAGHRVHTVSIGATVTRGLVDFARANQVTLNTAIAGAWSLVLSRWVRSPDVVFGTTVSGRPATFEGAERATGLFINTLPLRVNASPTQRLGPWLKQIQRSQVEARSYELASLASIQRWADVEPGESLFQSILVFENYPPSSERDPGDGVSLGSPEYIEQSNYPLAILAVPGDEITLSLVYDSALFSDEAVAGVGDQIATVARAFLSNPEARLAEISLVSPDDERRLSVAASGPELPEDDRTIHEIIASIAAQHPNDPAVTFGGETLSYGELLRRADGLAARLVALGVNRSQPVGLILDRSIEMVVGIVGILRSGAAYVPLDPSYPQEHIATLLSGDAIDVVVTRGDLAGSVPEAITTILLDDGSSTPAWTYRPKSTSADIAYIIHTSGSTGRPKGVMVTHRNLVHSTNARNLHYGGGVKRFLLLSSFSFDSSIAGIFWTLTTGGTLVLPSPGLEHDADALLDLVQRHEVTHTLALPTLYHVLLEGASDGGLATLEVAIVAGEACPPGVLGAHMALLPRTQLHNEYGPTEATVWCTAHRASADDVGKPLPIGRPIAGARIFLLDTHGHRVPLGFPGELCVAGPGLTPGYLNRPDLTAERFVTVQIGGTAERVYRTGDLAAFRTDGTLVFLGRADRQLKIRGHRIEPTAVESAISEDLAVEHCVVIGVPTTRSGHRLVAYVTSSDPNFDPDDVRSRLRLSLPAFLVPDRIVRLDALPMLPNGKVDRSSLPDPADDQRPASGPVAPRTETEATLVDIWSELLGHDDVGVTDDFFALGGDSIISIQMISRARQAGIPMEPGLVSTHPTIADLAAATGDKARGVAHHDPVVGEVPLGPAQRWFLTEGIDRTDQWNLSIALAVSPDIREEHLEQALAALIEHHDMLRARIRTKNGTWEQTVNDRAVFPFESVTVPADHVDAIISETQAALDLKHGPLARAVLIRTADHTDPLLVLVAHHLVVDVVSWIILVDDLESAYRQAHSGVPIALVPRTTSYRDWITQLLGEDWTDERIFWLTLARRAPAPPMPATRGLEADIGRHDVSLDRTSTAAFLGAANDAYSTRPDELLTAAVGIAVTELERSDRTWLSIEGHGRPTGVAEMDLTRTVGWFTSRYPIPIERQDNENMIKTVKETMRSIPRGGVGFGVLHDVLGDEEIRSMPAPQVNLNYVGRGIATADSSTFRWTGSEPSESRHRDARLPFAIEVIASIRSGELVLEFVFDSRSFAPDRIRWFAQTARTSLMDLIDHCVAEGAGGYTPSDFPEAGLDQAELDNLLAEL
ncbi:MAG: amino acid adenylation domain-containing protein [Acidimicrobiia bacterium]